MRSFRCAGMILNCAKRRKRSGRVRRKFYSLPFTVSERHDADGRRLSPSMKIKANVKHVVSICTSYIQIIFWSRSANFRLVFPLANCSFHLCSFVAYYTYPHEHVCSHEHLDASASALCASHVDFLISLPDYRRCDNLFKHFCRHQCRAG